MTEQRPTETPSGGLGPGAIPQTADSFRAQFPVESGDEFRRLGQLQKLHEQLENLGDLSLVAERARQLDPSGELGINNAFRLRASARGVPNNSHGQPELSRRAGPAGGGGAEADGGRAETLGSKESPETMSGSKLFTGSGVEPRRVGEEPSTPGGSDEPVSERTASYYEQRAVISLQKVKSPLAVATVSLLEKRLAETRQQRGSQSPVVKSDRAEFSPTRRTIDHQQGSLNLGRNAAVLNLRSVEPSPELVVVHRESAGQDQGLGYSSLIPEGRPSLGEIAETREVFKPEGARTSVDLTSEDRGALPTAEQRRVREGLNINIA